MGLLFLPRSRPRSIAQRGAAALVAAAAACGAAFVPTQAAHAQQVSAVFMRSGLFYDYNFTVRNTTSTTLADVNVSLPTGATATNLAAPTGFFNVFDANANGPGMGLVDFLADDNPLTPQDFFAGTNYSGFLLRTTVNLNGAAFNTFDVNGNSVSGIVTAVAAPEPGTLGLLAFGGIPAAVSALLAFRRRSSSASLKG